MLKLIPNKILKKELVKSSSSNSTYEVVLYDNAISCNCPAGGRKILCKHIREFLFNNLELIKQFPVLYKNVQNALTAHNNKTISNEDKKQIYSKILYVNSEIAQKSYENSYNLDLDFSKVVNETVNRATKFINTTQNVKKQADEALKLKLINNEEHKKIINALNKSIKTISNFKIN